MERQDPQNRLAAGLGAVSSTEQLPRRHLALLRHGMERARGEHTCSEAIHIAKFSGNCSVQLF